MNKLMTGSIAALALCAMNAAYAQKGAVYVAPTCGETSWYHSGFYVGGAIGGNQFVGNLEQEGFVTIDTGLLRIAGLDATLDLDSPSFDSDVQEYGFMGQLQLGYIFVGDWFFGGIEVSANATSGTNLGHDFENTFVTTSGATLAAVEIDVLESSDADIKMNTWEPVVDMKLGFKVTPNSVIYARVGAAWNQISLSNNFMFETAVITPATDVDVLAAGELSAESNVWGLRLGIGGEHRFSENVAVTLDYVHTNYYGDVDLSSGDVTLVGVPVSGTAGPVGTLSGSQEVSMARDNVMLGLNYYF